MEYNVEQINKLIKNRRSIFPFNYTGESIEDAVIDQILENANWAPNHKLTEPWRFKVFTGNALYRLSQVMTATYLENTPPEKQKPKKIEKFKDIPTQASHIIAICMKRDPKEELPEIEEIEAVACAVQNMHLTATAYGLGAYWGTGLAYAPQMKNFLNLNEKDRFLGFFFVGKPKKIHSGKRKPIADKVEWFTS